ncbi:hypothetical protein [Polynucleobacter sp. MWH-Aus1W21]|uniref:hypothetical protein n=1 Tax=Polynucleobacter sp. MWH-Aus1W21 TaxID=1855880 RepID=UPI001BFDC95A|nr:hypothetical protein [Polynucleobacter sp. MWH-Aus1W21]QWD66708.1 hypothetical protein ICW03_02510 [Polynucleobacter sp. MWH-Aus1W21]
MGDQVSHVLLLRAKLKSEAEQSVSDIFSSLRNQKIRLYQKIILTYSAQTSNVYAYFYLKEPEELSSIDPDTFLADQVGAFSEVEISRLVIQDFIKGNADGENALNRYVVEMDPESGWQEELFAWYDQEHLPGLASVPGCISATRCINLDHSPLSFAFYDLINPEVLGCDAWLKVRGTTWSDRVRPHFTNVKRAMFNIV